MTKLLDRIRNGVDSEQMYGTLDAIKATPELGVFQFRARNRWIDGAHNRSTIQGFYGAGQEDTSRDAAVRRSTPASRPSCSAPTRAPTPPSYLLHALAACLTTSLVYVAAAREVGSPRSSRRSRATWTSAARSASPTRCATASSASASRSASRATRRRRSCSEVVERAQARSAVFDMVTNGVPVDVGVVRG